ncbi:MAG: 8-amino-7-oxononanoate synthase [Bacteroidetes bacterium]|nr:8-amino-7-oxononanoate synthase [Bacteroidota bacterium]
MRPIEQYLNKKLTEREQAGNLRQLRTQRAAVDFFSNDYLGIATNDLLQPFMDGMNMGTGSTGSRLLSGNTKEAEDLEDRIAKFHRAEAALLFNSGYDANLGLITAVSSRHTTILYDELCHASLIDGIRLSHASSYKFLHNDLDDLEEKLERNRDKGPILIVTESVFSMDGDMALLEQMAETAERYDAAMIVDEAHATGVFGERGEGLVCKLGLADKVFARVHTYGKAMGCHGAAVLGSRQLKAFLVNFSRPFIFTTALPPHTISSINAAYEYLSKQDFSNAGLHELIGYFRSKILGSGIDGWKDSNSSIQALVVGGNENTKTIATALQNAGLQINEILHPTVPEGEERLRICLHAFNTREEIDKVFTIIEEANV